jgi:pantetheine-phosphate adenylyltransferase
MNGSMAPVIETVVLAACPATRMIASSLVKPIAAMGGDVTLFIPKEALAAVKIALKKPDSA